MRLVQVHMSCVTAPSTPMLVLAFADGLLLPVAKSFAQGQVGY